MYGTLGSWGSDVVVAKMAGRMIALGLSHAVRVRTRMVIRGLWIALALLGMALITSGVAFGQIVLPAAGDIDTVAGYGPAAYSGDSGAGTAADLNGPHGVAIDAAGNIYIADMWNNRIRKVTASTGIITTAAGNGIPGFSGDGGVAASAELYHPSGVTVDTAGNIYIADGGNNRIRKVTVSTGDISTVAGDGAQGYSGDGGPATSADLSSPYDVAVDASGNIYISDENNYRVRKVTLSTGYISTVAGNGTAGFTGNGGPATSAEISQPMQLATDSAGNVYFVDWGNFVIRKVTVSTGNISTVAGNGATGYSGDGGLATAARLNDPFGVAVDTAGNIYIADTLNNRIRMVSASTGTISTVAGNGTAGYSGDGGAATSAVLASPYGVAVDAANNIYIADDGNNRIRAVAQAKANPSMSVACSPNLISYGSETTTCTSTVNGGATGTVAWTINGGVWTSSTLSAGTTSAEGLSGWNAGTYAIAAAYSGDSNNNPVSSSTTLTISKATPTVSVICSPNALTYGEANSTCTVSAIDSGSVTGTVSMTYNGTAWTTLTLTSGSASATWPSTYGIGAYTIGATYNGDGNNATAVGSGIVTVDKASPTVSITSSVNPLTYGGLSVFTAAINGGQSPTGTVTFQVNGQTFGTATLSGGVAIYNGTNEAWAAGTYTISAIYSGDANNSGATGTITETINKANPAITWAAPAPIPYGTALSATQLDASSITAGTFTYTPASGTVLSAGSQILSTIFTPTDTTDYTAATGSVLLTVNPAPQIITFAALASPQVYGVSPIPLSASSTSGLTVTFSASPSAVCTASSSILTITGVGTCMVAASQAGNANYSAATAIQQSVVVNQVPTSTIVSSSVNPAMYGQNITLSAVVSTGGTSPTGTITFLDGTTTLGTTSVTSAQTTNILPTSTSLSSWLSAYVTESGNAATAPDGTLTATSIVEQPGTTGGQIWIGVKNSRLSLGYPYTGSVWMRVASGTAQVGLGLTGQDTVAGWTHYAQQTVTLTTQWQRVQVSGLIRTTLTGDLDFEVANSGISFQTGNIYYVWGGQLEQGSTAGPLVKTTSTAPLAGSGGIATFSTATLASGSHSISAVYSGDSYNAASTSPLLSQTVNDATPTLTLATSGTPTTYGSSITFTANISSGPTGTVTFFDGGIPIGTGTIIGTTATFTTTTLAGGSHTVTAGWGGNGNFNPVTSSAITQVVNSASQTITFSTPSSPVVYGVAAIALSASSTSGLGITFTQTGPCTVSSSTLTLTGAGTCTVTASQAGNGNYSAATSIPHTITVNAAILTVTAANASRNYGSANPTFTDTITGYVNGDTSSVVSGTASLTTSATITSPVGSYPITAAIGTLSASNYSFSFVASTMTINQARVSVTWSAPVAISYGTALSATQLDATSDGVSGSFAYTPGAGTVLGVGSQTLVVTFTPSDTTDYTATTASVTLEVTKSSVLINSTSSLNPSVYGDTVTWTFTFLGGGVTPTGTTTIMDGSVTLATVALNAGIATYNMSALVAGSHALVADYNGDNNYQ